MWKHPFDYKKIAQISQARYNSESYYQNIMKLSLIHILISLYYYNKKSKHLRNVALSAIRAGFKHDFSGHITVAQKVMYHWGTLVAQMATWSPGRTPMAMRERAKVSTSSRNWE